MSIINGFSRTACRLVVLSAVLLIPAIAIAEIRTTTRFQPPMVFGTAADGRIFAGDPLIGMEVVETRIYWNVVIDDGYDAADIFADATLPINTHSGFATAIDLDGPTLGWSGSGTFNHFEKTNRFDGFFTQAGTGFGSQSWGLPFDAVEILPTSRIEIDYIAVPEPNTAVLLALGLAFVGVSRRRLRA